MPKKISELPESFQIQGGEIFPLVQDGRTRKSELSAVSMWLASDIGFTALSSNWQSTYTTVSANSATWGTGGVGYDDSLLNAASGNWNNTFTTVLNESADWYSTHTTVYANSADWGTSGGTVQGTDSNELNLRARDEGIIIGGARGESSVDLQTSRTTSTQVASGDFSVIGGGQDNQSSGKHDTVGGGYDNAILDPMGFCNTIAGGCENYIIGYASSIGYANSIGGGTGNSIIGYANTIPGGVDNKITSNYSFATGRKAEAKHPGATVFSDSQDNTFGSLRADSFNVRARAGIRLVDGNEAVGKILTSDEYGHGTWQPASGGSVDTSIQQLSALGSHTAPNPLVIDLTQGLNVEGWLTANVSLQLSGAKAGESGLITLGNGNAHDGVGFTVDFYLDNTTSQTHAAGGHSVMAGDLADFATTPLSGEYNYGTIGWYYTGTEYLLYVSEVKPYTDSIEP